ncbi:MAG: PAS domain S-box protein [Bacteroidota bacterium]
MLLSVHTQELTGYFAGSEQFLYFLTDSRGTCKYVNPLFQRVFGDNKTGNTFSSHFTDPDKYHRFVRQCLQQKATLSAELAMNLPGGPVKPVRWEFSVCQPDDEDTVGVQAIGIMGELPGAETERPGRTGGILAERYKAYEQSPEGLWMFEMTVPVSVSTPPDEIIEHWRRHSHLAECNDTMARMYGYEKAGDLTGATIDQLIDFSDESRINNLRRFIRNRCRSTLVETKEFDRHGNTKYFLNSMEGTVENGLLIRVWGTQQDITEQRLAEEKIRYLALLMENVSDIILSQDKDFNVVSWNKAAEELYGYSADEVIGRKIPEVLHFEFQGISRADFFDILKNKGSWRGEAYTTNRFGKPLTVLITVTKIVNESGQLTGYVSVGKDITEKRKAEDQLKKNELFYRNLISNSLDAVLVTDSRGIISFASMSVTNILGYETTELTGADIFCYVHPEEKLFAVGAFERELKGASQPSVRIRLKKKTGEWIWCMARGHNLMDNPAVQGMILHVYDDTKRKQAEDKLRQQATILNNVTDIIVTSDLNAVITSWNRVAEEVTGVSSEEATGKFYRDVVFLNFSPFHQKNVISVMLQEGVWKGESSFINRRGEKKVILHTASLLKDEQDKPIGIISVAKDITERKAMETRLQESELFYRNLIAESVDGITLTDEKGFIKFTAPSAKKVLGYEPEEVAGKNVFDFVHPDDRDKAVRAFTNELGLIPQELFISARLLKKDGRWLWCIVRGHNMFSNPNVASMVIYYYDDTNRKKVLEELRNQTTTLSNVFDLIITTDFNYNVLSWNKRAEQVVGYTEEEVEGKFLGDFVRLDYGSYTSQQVADILEEKGYWQGEISFVNRHGVKKTVLHTASYLLNETGERAAIIGTGIDITEKKNAEEQVHQSELFYRNLFINSLDGVLITSPDGNIRFASPSVTTIFGYSTEEIRGRTTFEFAHPEDRHLAETAFQEELAGTPQRSYISVRIKNKTGEWVWCIVRGHNLLDNPWIKGMVVYLYDDTLRKKTENALIESENRFRTQATMLSNVTDVIVTTDLNRVVTSWNKVSEKLSGITEQEALGRIFRDVMEINYSPYTNDQVVEIVKREGIWRGEISFRAPGGETIYLLHTISVLHNEKGDAIGMIGVGKDITERKKMEAKLQQSESFYRSLTSHSLDGIVLTDNEGIIIHCAPSVFKISGHHLEDMMGHSIFEFVHPDDAGLAVQAFLTEVKKESVLNYVVIRLRHATRGWVWCTVRGHNLLHDPVLKAIVIYFTDDTKRKQIEDRLRESESRFRNMIHNLQLGVILQNEKSEILVCNEAALQMLGLAENQLLGTSSFDPRWNVIHEDGSDFPSHEHPVPVAIRLRQPVRDVVMGVFRPLSNDRVWLLVNAEPVFDDERNLINVICSFADITEQRRLSQQLIDQEIQKQKLITQTTIDAQEKEREEIGKELHDNINQHLTTTRLYLEVAGEKAAGELLEMINLAHKNLADIVAEIRRLSQSLVPPSLGDLGLADSIQELCDSLKRTQSYHVDFQRRFFDEKPLPGNLKLMIFRIIQEQVSNIIRHANARAIHIKLLADAENIIFSIADDGRGFDPRLYKKGLGFSNISNRASLFEGKVDIEAAPGRGCTVTVTIPMTAVLTGVK